MKERKETKREREEETERGHSFPLSPRRTSVIAPGEDSSVGADSEALSFDTLSESWQGGFAL